MNEPKSDRHDFRAGLLLFAPAFAVILLLFVVPIVYETAISLYRSRVYEEANPFVGLANYRWLFRNGDLLEALSNTLVWTFGSILGQGVIGVFLAVILMQDLPGRSLIRTLLLCTWIMPSVVVGIIWRWIFDPTVGILNTMLAGVGVTEVDWLGQVRTAMLCCIIANVWRGIPFWLLMISARLQAVPQDLYDAANVDGTGAWGRFRYVTLPQIRTILVLCTVLSFIWTFNSFDLIFALTRGGPDIATTTVPLLIYDIGIRYGHFGEAAASSILLLLMMVAAILVFVRGPLGRREDV
jgi:multiple sugar transport system permease protein